MLLNVASDRLFKDQWSEIRMKCGVGVVVSVWTSSREQAAGCQAAAAVAQQILLFVPLLLGSQQGGGVGKVLTSAPLNLSRTTT